MKDPLTYPFPRDLGHPVFRRWFIADDGTVVLVEVGVIEAEEGARRYRFDEFLVLNQATGKIEQHRDADRLFEGREEALCAAILRALDKLATDPENADLKDMVRIYRSADGRGRRSPIPSDCLDCRGTATHHEEVNGRLQPVERGGYCPTCRGTGVTIARREGETVRDALLRVERAFPGTAARKNW